MVHVDRRLDTLVENLAEQRRLARAIEAGAAVDAAELNRLVRERERLLDLGAEAMRAGAG